MSKTLSGDVPRVIAGYNIISQIGEGGMARVFRGRNGIGKEAAIKVIRTYYKNDPGFRERFRREAEALTQVEHDGIVRILQWVDEDDTLAMVMELLDGHPFNNHLDDVFSRNEDAEVVKLDGYKILENLRIMRDIALAMSHVHRKGVCHRDLKPDNIIITRGSRGSVVKIIDFGICHPQGSPRRTRVGVVIGTPGYMAPEQIIPGGKIDNRTDIYALGLMIFEAYTGSSIFAGHPDNLEAQYQLMRNTEFVAKRIDEESIPPHVAPIIKKCLMLKVEDRYFFMDQVVGALDLSYKQEDHYLIGRVGLLTNKKDSNEIVTVEDNILDIAQEKVEDNPFEQESNTARIARLDSMSWRKWAIAGGIIALITAFTLVFILDYQKQGIKVVDTNYTVSPVGMRHLSKPIIDGMRSKNISLSEVTTACAKVTPSIAKSPRSLTRCIRQKVLELYRLKQYEQSLKLALAAEKEFWLKRGWRYRRLVKSNIKGIYRTMGKLYRNKAAEHRRYSAVWEALSRKAAHYEQMVKNWGG